VSSKGKRPFERSEKESVMSKTVFDYTDNYRDRLRVKEVNDCGQEKLSINASATYLNKAAVRELRDALNAWLGEDDAPAAPAIDDRDRPVTRRELDGALQVLLARLSGRANFNSLFGIREVFDSVRTDLRAEREEN
jgi:hypothetical protein